MAIDPIITNAIPDQDIILDSNSGDLNINLSNNFDDPSTTGLVATFYMRDPDLTADGTGQIKVLLFDQTGVGAPLTVKNFVNYVNAEAYTNSIIDRSVPDFVIQGGGFTVQDLNVEEIRTNPPVQNEFSPLRSNNLGTIAMAKQGDNPNSATSQWFFNLADNSANLDKQNGGFTVFGQVLPDNLPTLSDIALVPVEDFSEKNPSFKNIPLKQKPPSSDNDYVIFDGIDIEQKDELEFTAMENSNSDLVKLELNGSNLKIKYGPGQWGKSEIMVTAKTLLGQSVSDSFVVTLVDPIEYAASNLDLVEYYGYDPQTRDYSANFQAYGQHYLTFGKKEGREIGSFNQKRYLASYDDLLSVLGNNPAAAATHYVVRGALIENRNPFLFDPAQYLASYDDLLNYASRQFGAFYNLENKLSFAQNHFLNSWATEHRPRDLFQEDLYLASYGDLIKAFAPLNSAKSYAQELEEATNHYITNGFSEGRVRQIFNPAAYLNKYKDLQEAFGNDLAAATKHYIEYGFYEGRNPA